MEAAGAHIKHVTQHDEDVLTLPDTGLPELDQPAPRKRGRKPLPADLSRERIEYDLPEDQKICPCCSHAMHRMGEEVSEHLHMEVKVSVLQHARFKYACRHCERHGVRTPIVVAPMPALPRPGITRERQSFHLQRRQRGVAVQGGNP